MGEMLCYQHGLYEDTERCPSCEQERKAKRDNHIDFRAHTCDECAWVTKGVLPYCRRVSWNCIPTRNDVQYSGHGLLDPKEPACPAYIPREAQP